VDRLDGAGAHRGIQLAAQRDACSPVCQIQKAIMEE
jgi:hypothetical protein